MTRRTSFVAFAFTLLFGAASCGDGATSAPPAGSIPFDRLERLTAAEVIAKYRDDGDGADRKFLKNYVFITGEVDEVGKDPRGLPFAIFTDGAAGKLRVTFEPHCEARVLATRKGDSICIVAAGQTRPLAAPYFGNGLFPPDGAAAK
jgi:hypothetical protein